MPREEFSVATKRVVAERAGYLCSFPTCRRTTVGPADEPGLSSRTGRAAHIYAAAGGGPRGQSGLTPEELAAATNAIWLCTEHAAEVDNNDGIDFPATTLLSFKALHEARMSLERGGLYPPIGWIHEVRVDKAPIFDRPQMVRLAKLNLFYGNNGSGKSALIDWICGTFDPSTLWRWRKRPLRWSITYLDPRPKQIDLALDSGVPLACSIDGTQVPFTPLGLRIVRLNEPQLRDASDPRDDVARFARVLGLQSDAVVRVAEEINRYPHARMRNVRFESDDEGVALRADLDGTAPGLNFQSFSGREQERVWIEFATAVARTYGRYAPALLVLDDGLPSIIFDGFFEYYERHFLDPDNQFQTILALPTQGRFNLDDVKWAGWQVVRFQGNGQDRAISQEIKVAR